MQSILRKTILLSFSLLLLFTLAACASKFYKVTYIATEGGSINGETIQAIESGSNSLFVTAIPDEGYRFKEWSDENKNPIRQELNLQTDITFIAYFEKVETLTEVFTVSYIESEGGSISGEKTQLIEKGYNGIFVTAIPDEGYRFKEWSDENKNTVRQEIDVQADLTLTSYFEKIEVPAEVFTVRYIESEGGSIAGKVIQEIEYGGETEQVTVDADTGYKFVGWSDDSTDKVRQDSNITESACYTAIFEKITVEIFYRANQGGSVSGDNDQSVSYGDDAKMVIAVPNEGYKFVKWSDDLTTAARQDTNVTSRVGYIAIFEKQTFLVQYVTDGNGVINGDKNQTIKYGEDAISVTAVPNQGYKFLIWSDGETDETRQATDVRENKTLTAYFIKQTFLAIYSAGEGGRITGEAEQSVAYGEAASSVEAVAYQGYRFVKWEDTDNTNPVRKDTNVVAAINAVAIFEKLTYTVKYITDGNGVIEENAVQEITHGEDAISVTAVPNEGYKFLIWSDGLRAQARQDINVTGGITLTAIFEKLKFSVNYIAGEGGYIIGEKHQTVAYGEDSVGVTAWINPGWMFECWSDGNGFNERADYNVTQDITVIANYYCIFGGGDGSAEKPLLIDNYQQLLMINLFPDSHYKLNADLNLQGINHLPMFHWGYMFNGSFDGGNHAISNLTVNRQLALPSLFGSIGELGSVKNLNIENVSIVVPNYNTLLEVDNQLDKETILVPLCVGSVAGVCYGKLENINIINAKFTAMRLDYNYIFIGGLAGNMTNSISNCHAEIEIELDNIASGGGVGTTFIVGGLVGRSVNDDSLEEPISILSCSAKGSINALFVENKGNRAIGGLIGCLEYAKLSDEITDELNITGCFSEMDIFCNYESDCGGLIALVSVWGIHINFNNCFSTGSITVLSDVESFVGGFLGSISLEAGLITDCYATTDINALIAAGFIRDVWGNPKNEFAILKIIGCLASSNIICHSGAGFIYFALDVSIYRCYTIVNIQSNFGAAGFIYFASFAIVEGSIVECFSTGDVTAKTASGLICDLVNGVLKNCYSKCNIYKTTSSISRHVGGLVVDCNSALIINCYYAGEIKGDLSYNLIGAIVYSNIGQVINCHWLKTDNNLKAIGFDYSEQTDTSAYDDILDMYFIAELLNDGETAWINILDNTPQLIYFN